jgi:hypothetical protein
MIYGAQNLVTATFVQWNYYRQKNLFFYPSGKSDPFDRPNKLETTRPIFNSFETGGDKINWIKSNLAGLCKCYYYI